MNIRPFSTIALTVVLQSLSSLYGAAEYQPSRRLETPSPTSHIDHALQRFTSLISTWPSLPVATKVKLLVTQDMLALAAALREPQELLPDDIEEKGRIKEGWRTALKASEDPYAQYVVAQNELLGLYGFNQFDEELKTPEHIALLAQDVKAKHPLIRLQSMTNPESDKFVPEALCFVWEWYQGFKETEVDKWWEENKECLLRWLVKHKEVVGFYIESEPEAAEAFKVLDEATA